MPATKRVCDVQLLQRLMASNEYAARIADGRLYAQRLILAHRPEPRMPVIRPAMAHIVSGGTKGLGMAYAQQLISKGARYLVLMGRNPVLSRHELAALASTGVTLFCVRCVLQLCEMQPVMVA